MPPARLPGASRFKGVLLQYGIVQGRFLVPDGQQTPLSGQIIFEPVAPLESDPGIDYVQTRVIGYLDDSGSLRSANGNVLELAYGEWEAYFRLRLDKFWVSIKPKRFFIKGDVWITQIPGGGWEFEIVPIGDGTADLLSQNITNHNDGTATLKIG